MDRQWRFDAEGGALEHPQRARRRERFATAAWAGPVRDRVDGDERDVAADAVAAQLPHQQFESAARRRWQGAALAEPLTQLADEPFERVVFERYAFPSGWQRLAERVVAPRAHLEPRPCSRSVTLTSIAYT